MRKYADYIVWANLDDVWNGTDYKEALSEYRKAKEAAKDGDEVSLVGEYNENGDVDEIFFYEKRKPTTAKERECEKKKIRA